MPFKKGQSGNPAGRKKGSLNKVNKDRKAFISYVLDLNKKGIVDVLNKLKETDPAAYLNALLKLLEYDTPKLNRVTSEINETMKLEPVEIKYNIPGHVYEELTLEELQILIDYMKKENPE